MSSSRTLTVLTLVLGGCGQKNECGGDKPLPFKPGTLCDPLCSDAVWLCADRYYPGINLPNHVACKRFLSEPAPYPSNLHVFKPSPPEAIPGVSCEIKEAQGECRKGTWQCKDEDPGLGCSQTFQPEPEQCDSLDNDCDGEVDELPAIATPGENDERRVIICRSCPDLDGIECVARCEEEVSRESNPQNNSQYECWAWCHSEDSLLECSSWWTQICDDNDRDGFFDIECGNHPADAHYGDCDDTDSAVSPDNPEVCDGFDNNCDGLVDTGPCEGVCGAGTLLCQGGLVPLCSTDYGGPDYLPSRALCSTCGDPFPNGTIDPETGACVAHSSCTVFQYEDLPTIIYAANEMWDLCPWMEGCGNELDDDGDGIIDEDCSIPARCSDETDASCNDSYARRIEYDLFEQWCPGLNRHEGRRDLIQDLLDWIAVDLCEPIESDPVLTFILQHLDSNETCTESLFHWLYWLETNQYAAEVLCGQNAFGEIVNAGLVDGEGWVTEFFSNPCANSMDRRHFTQYLLIPILSRTSRITGVLQEEITPPEACISGMLDFTGCPVPTSLSICIAQDGGNDLCAEVENPRLAAGTRCVETWACNEGDYIVSYDRCDNQIGFTTEGEYCQYGCNPETVTCNPCGCGCAACGPDNCGNSCGECNYDDVCIAFTSGGQEQRICQPGSENCFYLWTFGEDYGFDNPWIPNGGERTIDARVSMNAERICIEGIPLGTALLSMDGIAGPASTSAVSCAEVTTVQHWPTGCYDVYDHGLDGLIADSRLTLIFRTTWTTYASCFACNCATGLCDGGPTCDCLCPELTTLIVHSCAYTCPPVTVYSWYECTG